MNIMNERSQPGTGIVPLAQVKANVHNGALWCSLFCTKKNDNISSSRGKCRAASGLERWSEVYRKQCILKVTATGHVTLHGISHNK